MDVFITLMSILVYLVFGILSWCLWYYKNHKWTKERYTTDFEVAAVTIAVTVFWPIYMPVWLVVFAFCLLFNTLAKIMDSVMASNEKIKKLK